MSFRATLATLRQSAAHVSHTPNAPIELEPSLRRLLHDTDLSVLRNFRHGSKHYVERTELEVEEPDAFKNPPPEFEGYEVVERRNAGDNGEDVQFWDGPREERRSPAAIYGTKHLGMVAMPWELGHAVEKAVEDCDKHQLRSDAKRLFFYPTPNVQPANSSSSPSKIPRKEGDLRFSNKPPEWQLSSPAAASLSFSTKGNYKTVVQVAPRESLAFATITIPAHYAATENVFREVARRMAGPGHGQDRIETVIDFGGKSGQGLWASLLAFRESVPPPESTDSSSSPSSDETVNPESWTPISASPHHPRVGISSAPSTSGFGTEDPESDSSNGGTTWTASTVKKYMLLDSRRGMTELARRFIKGTDLGGCEVLYQDYWGKNTQLDVPERSLALCAFTLSELPTGTSRKRMVSEMWESGAEWMVIIDHGTPSGFDSVAQARELLLQLGRQEVEGRTELSLFGQNTRESGSHVVAPCPHSHACPLYNSPHTRDVCHFTQRIQTPPFLRHTKHSHEGHEDVAYSYVVVRRGQAPNTRLNERFGSPVAQGLVGAVGREEAEKALLDLDHGKPKGRGRRKDRKTEKGRTVLRRGEDGVWGGWGLSESTSHTSQIPNESELPSQHEEISEESALRSAIGTWPRIVYPPMKRSGHVIFDTCTHEGSIARMTIPKSQGKQAYYDARKASWGDAFPHAPRITPQVRTRGIRRLGPVVPSVEEEEEQDEINMEINNTKGKNRPKRKGLREARRRDEAPLDVDLEDWMNTEASEIALQLQAKLEREEADRQQRLLEAATAS